jgi:hypothetical protein
VASLNPVGVSAEAPRLDSLAVVHYSRGRHERKVDRPSPYRRLDLIILGVDSHIVDYLGDLSQSIANFHSFLAQLNLDFGIFGVNSMGVEGIAEIFEEVKPSSRISMLLHEIRV